MPASLYLEKGLRNTLSPLDFRVSKLMRTVAESLPRTRPFTVKLRVCNAREAGTHLSTMISIFLQPNGGHTDDRSHVAELGRPSLWVGASVAEYPIISPRLKVVYVASTHHHTNEVAESRLFYGIREPEKTRLGTGCRVENSRCSDLAEQSRIIAATFFYSDVVHKPHKPCWPCWK